MMQKDTIAVHGGSFKDETTNSVIPPMYLSTTFERDDQGLLAPKGFYYTRLDNPNRKALEEKLAMLEEGAEAFAFSSGMSACLAIFQSVLQPGSHFLLPDDCYHGVYYLVEKMLPRWGVTHTEVDMTDLQAVQHAIRSNTVLIMIETPSNPLLKITDIEGILAIARSSGIVVACDDTWTTPYLQQPLAMGADIVYHSSSKFFGGHSDVLGGCVIVRQQNQIAVRLREFQQYGGCVPSPFDCWLLYRSLATLPLRIRKQMENAEKIVDFLAGHPGIEKVFYPGLACHPGHQIAKKQMTQGYGTMLSVAIKGGKKQAMTFAGNLTIFKHATSLGGVESLVDHRRSVEVGIQKSPDNLVRISVGIEHVSDLIEDLTEALKMLR